MLRFVKKRLLRLLEDRGYCISFGEPATFASIVGAFRKRSGPFSFLQIGAFDGRESDPIHEWVRKDRWHGILVEPQPEAFQALQQNYAGCEGLIFENVAIADQPGPLPLYRLKAEHAGLFSGDYRMLASFDPQHILKHLSQKEEADRVLESEEIPCLSLASLLSKHAVKALDMLVIDAEGYDYQILRAFPFDRLKPRIVRFEHAHLSVAEKGECLELLIAHSYKVVTGGYDMTAYQAQWMFY